MALESTHLLTEMSTWDISWRVWGEGKGGRYLELITLTPPYAECIQTESLNLLEPSGLYRDYFSQ
jgi:hypothetical protein